MCKEGQRAGTTMEQVPGAGGWPWELILTGWVCLAQPQASARPAGLPASQRTPGSKPRRGSPICPASGHRVGAGLGYSLATGAPRLRTAGAWRARPRGISSDHLKTRGGALSSLGLHDLHNLHHLHHLHDLHNLHNPSAAVMSWGQKTHLNVGLRYSATSCRWLGPEAKKPA